VPIEGLIRVVAWNTEAMGATAVGGARVAELRKARGVTQAALARRASVPVSLLSRIEIGDRVLSPTIAAALARALRISLGELYGEAKVSVDQSALLEDLRTAVRRGEIPDQTPVPDPAQLRLDVDHALTLRDHAELAGLLQTLPGLLTRATTHAHAAASPAGWALLTEVYSVTFHLAAQHQWMDLVEIVPVREVWAATRQPNPLVSALAAGTRAGSFLHCGDFEGGLTVVERALVSAETTLTGPEKAFVTGVLHLRGIELAGLLNERAEAQRHLHAAGSAVEEFPTEVLVHGQRFGPASISATVVVAEGELGRPREVIRLAEELTSKNTELPATRLCDVHTHTARAHLELGNRDGAQTSLAQAWDLAAQKAKIDPMSSEVLRVLISLHRRSNPSLLTLAKQAGLPA
jgi:transcriptional regulator with XRE-family HTH domain